MRPRRSKIDAQLIRPDSDSSFIPTDLTARRASSLIADSDDVDRKRGTVDPLVNEPRRLPG